MIRGLDPVSSAGRTAGEVSPVKWLPNLKELRWDRALLTLALIALALPFLAVPNAVP